LTHDVRFGYTLPGGAVLPGRVLVVVTDHSLVPSNECEGCRQAQLERGVLHRRGSGSWRAVRGG